MKVLVTGGNGFLGSFVMERLKRDGHEAVTFSSRQYDLTDPVKTTRLFDDSRPDAVIHLAARVGGIGANKANPGKFAYENLAMGQNVIHIANLFKTRKVVIAGTICAYPKHTPVPFKEEDLWNGYPEETNAPYGIAKKMLLVLSQSYRQQYGANFVYLLPVNLYGPKDNFDLETSHVIPAMIRKFHEAKESNSPNVTLWGDGSPTREFLYVEDCADAFVQTLNKYNDGDPMNIGSGHEISMKNLAELVKSTVVYSGEIIWDTSRPNGQPRRCLDTSRAKNKLGWVATTKLEEGLKKTYEWYIRELSQKV